RSDALVGILTAIGARVPKMADWIEHGACFADHRLACYCEDARIWDGDTEDTDHCGTTETRDEVGWSPGVRGSCRERERAKLPGTCIIQSWLQRVGVNG